MRADDWNVVPKCGIGGPVSHLGRPHHPCIRRTSSRPQATLFLVGFDLERTVGQHQSRVTTVTAQMVGDESLKLTSGQGMGVAWTKLPKQIAATMAEMVMRGCILVGKMSDKKRKSRNVDGGGILWAEG